MYDEYDEHGILIQKYGPHFLNTDNYSIIAFLQQYMDICIEHAPERYMDISTYLERIEE